jgi:DNA sulfur modification protein DndC
LENIKQNIKELYLSDTIPWIVGYSGGKDSTATLQLIWEALSELDKSDLHKEIHVLTNDTLVENPIVSMWVEASLKQIDIEAKKQNLPFVTHMTVPEVNDSFWVNLIGRGYPAPRPRFRWCTQRLKINPANKYVLDVLNKYGEAIMVLGTRKAESSARKKTIEKHEGSTRSMLSRNHDPQFDRVWIYAPIKEWSNDEVWEYLATHTNPWKYDNGDLINMYRGATKDKECPMVVDSSTPSCGDSRFGCYVCTLVDKDKSMSAMIINDDEKKWMSPLADFRNKYLDVKNDHQHREFRRSNGSLTVMQDKLKGGFKLIPGAYKQSYRHTLLSQLLLAQEQVKNSGVKGTENFEIIRMEELMAIRELWVIDKNEIEDVLPDIFLKCTGKEFPYTSPYEGAITKEDITMLRESNNNSYDDIHYQLIRNLISIEQKHSTTSRRVGVYDELEKNITRGCFEQYEDALAFALKRSKEKFKDVAEINNVIPIKFVENKDITNEDSNL